MERVYVACVKHDVEFIFGQTGNIFVKDGKEYKIRNRTDQMVQALRSGLRNTAVNIDAEVNAILDRKAAMKEAMAAKRKPKK